jgi:hypothetical protein
MKLFSKIFICFQYLSSFVACGDGNYTNISIIGIVKDSLSNRPIINATVHTKCWVYSTQRWESSTVEKETKTDSNGKFQLVFDKGEAIDMSISAPNYQTIEVSKTLKQNKVEIETYLQVK